MEKVNKVLGYQLIDLFSSEFGPQSQTLTLAPSVPSPTSVSPLPTHSLPSPPKSETEHDSAPSNYYTLAHVAHVAVAGHQPDQALDGDRLRKLQENEF